MEVGWVATPTPSAPTEPTLIPIVTTASSVDALELAQVYTHRWPAQETAYRFPGEPGPGPNHGFAKVQVEELGRSEDREGAGRKLAKAHAWPKAHGSGWPRPKSALEKLESRVKAHRAKIARLGTARQQMAEQPERPDPCLWARTGATASGRDRTGEVPATETRAEETYRVAFATCERACCQQRTLLRELEDLKKKERVMYELEHAKDQVMTVLKLALANLVMSDGIAISRPLMARLLGIGWHLSSACQAGSSGVGRQWR